jgi:hypothetical protein
MNKSMSVYVLKRAKEVLSHKRSDLKRGKVTFICHAIETLHRSHPIEVFELTALISHRLNGRSTYTSWLNDAYPGVYPVYYDINYKQIQLSRHAWIDSLIEEFS